MDHLSDPHGESGEGLEKNGIDHKCLFKDFPCGGSAGAALQQSKAYYSCEAAALPRHPALSELAFVFPVGACA